MINVNDIKNGVTIMIEGQIYQVVEFLHVKPGKGSAFMKTKLRNLRTGGIVEKTFNTNVKFEKANISKQNVQYLYNTGDTYFFIGWDTEVVAVTGATTYTAQYVSGDVVATVTTAGGVTTPYTTWDEALSAANISAGCTLRLYKDVAVTSYQTISASMTLDLNGCTLSREGTGNTLISIPSSGISLVIDDSRGGGKLYLLGSATSLCRALSITGTVTITINGGTIQTVATANNATAVYLSDANATLDLNNGILMAESTNNSYSGYAVYYNGGGYSNIEGGKLKAETAIFYNSTAARTTLRGGYYSLDPGTSLTIASGYIKQQITSAAMDPEYSNGYTYRVIPNSCSILWKNETGSKQLEADLNQTYGSTTAFNGTTPAKDATAQYTYTFDGWTTEPNGEGIFYANGSTPAVDGDATYYAHFVESVRHYDVTFDVQGHGDAPASASVAFNGLVTEPSAPSASGYAFGGWYKEEECLTAWNFSSDKVMGATTLFAKWTIPDVGFYADIVDVDNSGKTLTINASGWATSGWPYTVNDVAYGKNNTSGETEYREADRTLILPYGDKTPGENFTITVKNKSSETVSLHTYVIPQEITAATTLTAGQSKPIFVKGATLTIDGNISAQNIYVAPDAKLVVNAGKTLTADTVFLRTIPERAAELVYDGTISGEVYYTRIIKSKSGYFQFGLPLSCAISEVRLSNNGTAGYKTSSGWILRYYNEASRATNGPGENWATLDAAASIEAGKGYEMFSGVDYYREFYFPVDLDGLSNTVNVAYTAGSQSVNNGWNVLVSPLTRTLSLDPKPEDITVNWMQLDGSFEQENPASIAPVKTFAYQAVKAGTITFGESSMTVPTLAPRRRVAAAEEPERIQWIHLNITNAEGEGDQTSVYSHPTRYEDSYKTGIDVAKQSLTASRAILYTSHAYGDMAFAGVADSLLESGIALTVYSPAAQELTISLRENEWLNRLAQVLLIDHETGAQVDLLDSDYTFDAVEGTIRGRFTIMGRFLAPQITTDIEDTQSGEAIKARKLMINQKIFIEVNDRLYDATGKLVNKK